MAEKSKLTHHRESDYVVLTALIDIRKGLFPRALNACWGMTEDDIAHTSDREFLRLRNVGRKTIRAIRERIPSIWDGEASRFVAARDDAHHRTFMKRNGSGASA